MKQFNRFNALVPNNFEDLMIDFWMEDETVSKEVAKDFYYGPSFMKLVNRIKGKECKFKPDLGYNDSEINGTLCFEEEDNDFVIPIAILKVFN